MQVFPSHEDEKLCAFIFGRDAVSPLFARMVIGQGRPSHQQRPRDVVVITSAPGASNRIVGFPASFDEALEEAEAIVPNAIATATDPGNAELNVFHAVDPQNITEETQEEAEFRTLPERVTTLAGLSGRIRVSVSAAEFVRRARGRTLKIESLLEEEPE